MDQSFPTLPTVNGNPALQFHDNEPTRLNKALNLQNSTDEHVNSLDSSENVNATISEDLADGHNASLEASLGLLGEEDTVLRLPGHLVEDEEIHMIETSVAQSSEPRSKAGALADHQMQLMLLEQQNKKRQMVARDEVQKAAALTIAQEKERQSSYQGFNSIPSMPNMSAIKHKMSSGSVTERSSKKPKVEKQTQTQTRVYHDTGNIDNALARTTPSVLHKGLLPYVDLLYSVSCVSNHSNETHPVLYFRDVPIPNIMPSRRPNSGRNQSEREHFSGKVPVLDIEAYLEDDTDDIAFTIIRTVECSDTSVLIARAGGHPRWTENIYIKSKILKTAMKEIATCYFRMGLSYQEGRNDRTNELLRNSVAPTDLFFFHHRTLLSTHSTKVPEAKQHIHALLEYINSRYGSEFSEASTLFERGMVNGAHISKLFKPNELVVSGTHGKPAAFVLQQWPTTNQDGWITLVCWSFQSDGNGFARKLDRLDIPPLGAKTMNIRDLVAYPLRFATPELRDSIRHIGEKQWHLRKGTQVTYKGWNVGKDQFYPDARFMIDHRIYRKMHESAQAFRFSKPLITFEFDRMPAYVDVEQEPPDICFFLMQPDIHGFYLHEKKWIKLFVDCIQPVSWNKKAYDRLVLPDRTKDLVRALVTVRTSHRGVKQGLGAAGKRTDITSGKGNGLIMLLHGGPGTGKTLTAESVAEIAEMPLYRVTCGDIGTNAEAVEKYLNTVLYLGKTWNCVLLLDEADIFLEERSMSDLMRNSLVSVFLRILEYYDGILILTSNRVGIFDEAFKSRIQVSLHYENLHRAARKKIWQNFLDMLEEDGEDACFSELSLRLDDLAGKELNGRQIRNVLTTARQLAMYRNERLNWEHLEQALAVAADFDGYVKRMQGHTDDQRARDMGLR